MNFFLETLRCIVLFVYYLLESLVFLVVPGRKKNVSGEIVLITGAGSGIGRVLAIKFASLGATVVLWDINQEGLNCAVRLARENGAGRVHSYICDCSKRQDIYRVADQVKKEVGDVSILINNAGIVIGKRFLDSPDSLLEKTMEVNTMAHFWTYKAFLPAMIAANHGHLVSITSCAGLCGANQVSDYCASKFAAIGFAESIDMEMRALRKTGVKTTIVCPFAINTGMFDGVKSKWPRLAPVLDPEYVAERIISAVRQNQEVLFIPRIIYTLHFLKSFLPVKAAVLLLDYFGAFDIMNTFKGRPKNE
ncbi:PREDICTED: epidermal retinol dehydrogenase 2-like [Pseudopodoces humilis]|uniref:epidermal retinol dehydrogenase 2-like n=1 Tax=Pseudopodoces humilis TaxID=181119 RepID=UPI000395743A|nr:PREDICTED: epidermal retinol dehydrogenase 2-like [Pseudopodoces humilis]XP_014113652.1 PREDICTED: epidermal retinol dehydrogenase 2-like [Pseudopodoces humilis]